MLGFLSLEYFFNVVLLLFIFLSSVFKGVAHFGVLGLLVLVYFINPCHDAWRVWEDGIVPRRSPPRAIYLVIYFASCGQKVSEFCFVFFILSSKWRGIVRLFKRTGIVLRFLKERHFYLKVSEGRTEGMYTKNCTSLDARALNNLFESKVEIPRMRIGKKQTIETLINEEALLLAKFLRNERKTWKPRIVCL